LKPFAHSTLSFSPPQVMLALPNAFVAICARGETYARRWLPEGNGQGYDRRTLSAGGSSS
jgi:hypothetical protein